MKVAPVKRDRAMLPVLNVADDDTLLPVFGAISLGFWNPKLNVVVVASDILLNEVRNHPHSQTAVDHKNEG